MYIKRDHWYSLHMYKRQMRIKNEHHLNKSHGDIRAREGSTGVNMTRQLSTWSQSMTTESQTSLTMWQISREVSIWFVIHIIDLWWRAVLDRYFWRKDFIQELDLKVGEKTRLACATCDILYRFPNRVKNSIASFVARASGSSSKVLLTLLTIKEED